MKRLAMIVLLAAGSAMAQEAARPAEPPAKLPSLDELLGLAKPGESLSVPSRAETALRDQLSPEQLRDEVEQAVKLMGDAAQRVTDGKDVGIETQRLQDEILQKLDKIIEDAKRQQQQQQQQQQSQSQSQQQQQQQQQDQQQSQSQQQQQRQQSGQQTSQQQQAAATSDGNRRPGSSEGELKPTLSGAATWGNLPPKAREQLMQGFGDTFSSMYRRMTESYYKRLAEEPKRE